MHTAARFDQRINFPRSLQKREVSTKPSASFTAACVSFTFRKHRSYKRQKHNVNMNDTSINQHLIQTKQTKPFTKHKTQNKQTSNTTKNQPKRKKKKKQKTKQNNLVVDHSASRTQYPVSSTLTRPCIMYCNTLAGFVAIQ